MPKESPVICFNKNEMRMVIRVEAILNNETNASVREHLAIPEASIDFCDVLHQDIYQKILEPHNRGLTASAFVAFFLGYFDDKKRRELQIYHARLNHVFKILHEEFFPTKEIASSNYHLQLNAINDCLMKYLCFMANQLPWHQEACALFILKSKSNIRVIHINDDGKVELLSYKFLYFKTLDCVNELKSQLSQFESAQKDVLQKLSTLEIELAEVRQTAPPPSVLAPRSPRFLAPPVEIKAEAECEVLEKYAIFCSNEQ